MKCRTKTSDGQDPNRESDCEKHDGRIGKGNVHATLAVDVSSIGWMADFRQLQLCPHWTGGTMKISPETRVAVSPEVMLKEVGGEAGLAQIRPSRIRRPGTNFNCCFDRVGLCPATKAPPAAALKRRAASLGFQLQPSVVPV